MTSIIIKILLALLSMDQAAALRSTAPQFLTTDEAAHEHLLAATIAGVAFDVDRDLLLSTAFFESNYQAGEQTAEPGRRVSCGVMTPKPLARCPERMTVLDGYLAGAQHLREWLDRYRGNVNAALLGYAGGGEHGLVAACRRGPVVIVRPSGLKVDACTVAPIRRARAERIRRAIASVEARGST